MSPRQLSRSAGSLVLIFLLSACSSEALVALHKEARADDVSTPAQVREGTALVERFECARCHQGAGTVSEVKRCTGCHQDILRGEFDAEASVIARWQERLADSDNALIDSLDLSRAAYFRRDWIAAFLMNPHDLRPALGPMMPRLALREEEAFAIARALVPSEVLEGFEGDAARGEDLVRQGRCGRCHLRDGETLPGHALRTDNEASVRRAPDLAHVDRWQSTHLLRWLMDPRGVDENTTMPQTGFSLSDARDVMAFLMPPTASSTSLPLAESERLPLLERDVFHEEVESRVFRQLCWHCHGDPDYARAEGGPGNTGGFGFDPRRLDLSSYEGVMSGAVDENGRRYSVLFGGLLSEDGVPRIVEVLLARHLETRGEPQENVRGMPLGMPPLSFEDIQLVESWVAQGARR